MPDYTKVTAVFDVDGTLINPDGTPRHDIINILKEMKNRGACIIVHSGGGAEYAQRVVKKLELEEFVNLATAKQTPSIVNSLWNITISFDDQEVSYGKTQVRV